MAPHRPRKSKPTESTTDEDDMIMYDVQAEELEPNPEDKFAVMECFVNNPSEYMRALTPTRFRNRADDELIEMYEQEQDTEEIESVEPVQLEDRMTVATLGSIPIRRFCVRRPVPGRPRATTPAEDRFLALSTRRRRTTTVPQLVADHFQASGRRISATTVRNRLHNAGLYARRPVVCVPLNGRQRRNRLCWAREHVSWTQQQWASVLFTDESRFTMESDSGRLLIWRGTAH
ncbi:HTH_Tnp_Tc3_2 domain-containing protein [Trichonephila clavipes]|nr:HTH_Tnp_Tc3_2 domain-containing protein [Trichonephila clavipes]